MADIEITRKHNLGMKAARAAADEMAAHLGRKFDLKGRWEGDVLRFERPGVTGSLAITDSDLDLRVTLGLLLRMMRSPLESAIHEELDKLFARRGGSGGAKATPPAKKGPARPKKGG